MKGETSYLIDFLKSIDFLVKIKKIKTRARNREKERECDCVLKLNEN